MRNINTIILFFMLVVTSFSHGQTIDKADFTEDPNGMPGELIWKEDINISGSITKEAVVEVTSKGNGTLNILNVSLRVWDSHNNGAYYQNVLLTVQFMDNNSDGYKDILVSGTVIYTDEDSGDYLSSENVTFEYRYNNSTNKFDFHTKNASFNLEDGPTG